MLRHLRDAVHVARQLGLQFDESVGHLGRRCFAGSALGAGPAPPDNGWIPPAAEFYARQHQWNEKYCRQRQIMSVGQRYPTRMLDAYIAPSAVIAGDVDIHGGAIIMHGSVVRGDLNNISIYPLATVQENCVIHAAKNSATGLPATTVIGLGATIGAGSLLRSCRIGGMAIVGERSIVMEGSVVAFKAILMPGTVVPPAKLIPEGEVWGGNPARFVRNLTHDEVAEVGHVSASHEKWRDLYVAEELPYGGNWKEAERVDPTEARLFPEGKPPDWAAPNNR